MLTFGSDETGTESFLARASALPFPVRKTKTKHRNGSLHTKKRKIVGSGAV